MTTSLTSSIEPRFRSLDGLTIRYADSGASRGPTLLLTSPWPESVYAFARMWATLAEHARLFAIDLPCSARPSERTISYRHVRWASSSHE